MVAPRPTRLSSSGKLEPGSGRGRPYKVPGFDGGFSLPLEGLTAAGAPLAAEIAEFFHSTGLLILEGYGLTETSAASSLNRPSAYRFGTVGWTLPQTEVKIAQDGEIMLKGPGIMDGYHNNTCTRARLGCCCRRHR